MSRHLHQPRTARFQHIVLVIAMAVGLTLAWQPLKIQPVYAALTFPDPIGLNLLVNGSFETPALAEGGVEQTNALPGWSIPSGQAVEIQRNAIGIGAAQDGAQLLELDAAASGSIAQSFPTSAGTVYEVTFAYSPRPGYGTADNAIGVYWNNVLQGTKTVDGASNTDTYWQIATLALVATSSTSTVSFSDAGVSNSFGMLLDNVVVRAATCETRSSGTWTDPTTWSCAGSTQVPGPGNYDVINSGHTLDTYGVSSDIYAIMLLMHEASTLMRQDSYEMRVQELNTERDSKITAAEAYKQSALFAAEAALIAGTMQAVGGIAAGAMSLTGSALVKSSTIAVSGDLKLLQNATITEQSKITATGTVTLSGQSKIAEQTDLTTYKGVQVGDHATIDQTSLSMIWSQAGTVLGMGISGFGSITNSTLTYDAGQQAAQVAKLEAQVHATLYATFDYNQLIVDMRNALNTIVLQLDGIMQTQMSVLSRNLTSSLTPSSAQFATVGALADLGTPQGVVILESTTPLTIDGLTVDAGQVLQIGANTTVTLTGDITNNGSINLADATSRLLVASGAEIITGGTLTDAKPAEVGPINASTPVSVGGTVTASASFTDTVLDTHHAVWTWGDGSIAQLPADDATGSASATHQYTTAGAYTISLVVWDAGGNASAPVTATVTIVSTTRGFQQPVVMHGVVNTVKAGATVPLKFEVFNGAAETNESTQVADIKSLTAALFTCSAAAPTDGVEVVTTGGRSLRYDATAGQFVYNWQTPKNGVGKCYSMTMTTQDGSTLTALFKLK